MPPMAGETGACMGEIATRGPLRGRRNGPPKAPRPLRIAAAALAVLVALAHLEAQAQDPPAPPGPFPDPLVYLRDIDPGILQDIRYAGPDNFTGRPVPGYAAGECVLLREAAEALARVQRALAPRGLSLKVYDCYRPRQAVRAFVAWVKAAEKAPADPLLKRFHPNIDRSRIITDGYVAAVSQHSRGDTVDLTLVELPAGRPPPYSRQAVYGPCTGPASARAPDNSVDMGTGYDCFDPLSHTAAPGIGEAQARWRRTLVEAMAREGFRNYRREWWHFTLTTARAPRSFSVPIVPRP
jgi:D-alanyl-D-alanine dipeptidase